LLPQLLSCFILRAGPGGRFDAMKFQASQAGRLGRDRGTEIAEAAVVLPILFMLLMAVFWFGRALSIYGTINHAAREGIRVASVPACANCGPACTWAGSLLPCDSTVVNAVNDALLVAHLDPNQATPSMPNPAPQQCPDLAPTGSCATASGGGFTICRNVVLNQNSGSVPVCGTIISFEYPYQLVFPFSSLNHQRIMLKAQVEMRGED
jgi:TadE-like protein